MLHQTSGVRIDRPNKSSLSGTTHSYYNSIDYIPYAVLHIPATVFITSNLILFLKKKKSFSI